MKKIVIAIILTVALGPSAWCLELESASFKNRAFIPEKYTCDSSDISPQLRWSDAPPATKSFAIICDDPDAPIGTWVHWVIFNIPAKKNSLRENISKVSILPNGMIQGINSFGSFGYRGPCPPSGKPHRYFFKLYALDTILTLSKNPDKNELLKAMDGHILSTTQIHGLYKR